MYLIFLLLSVLTSPFSSVLAEDIPPLKKITVTESNNYLPSMETQLYPVDKFKIDELKKLRAYVENRIKFKSIQEPKIILEIMEWVSLQWEHNGFNEAPDGASALDILKDVHTNKTCYRCVEYAQVTAEILCAFGYPARRVALRTIDVAYGGFGQGHVAVEVWSNTLGKWIFIDPQFSIYPVYKEKILNYYEIYEFKKKGQFADITFNVMPAYVKDAQSSKDTTMSFDANFFDQNYRDFIQRYFGYIGTSLHLKSADYSVVLGLDGKDQTFTFQGQPVSNGIFTHSPKDLYFELNQTLMVFHYQDQKNSAHHFQKQLEQLNIKTEEEYFEKMSLFSVKPDFTVSLLTNTPWHEHYEYRTALDGTWIQVRGDSFIWSLTSGDNYLEARSVNTMGIPGPGTFMKIDYQ
ncbi:MAG: transglutaminase domain-containing protein [Parachlamydiaceae bacterium]